VPDGGCSLVGSVAQMFWVVKFGSGRDGGMAGRVGGGVGPVIHLQPEPSEFRVRNVNQAVVSSGEHHSAFRNSARTVF
jgi:hypothetical protein